MGQQIERCKGSFIKIDNVYKHEDYRNRRCVIFLFIVFNDCVCDSLIEEGINESYCFLLFKRGLWFWSFLDYNTILSSITDFWKKIWEIYYIILYLMIGDWKEKTYWISSIRTKRVICLLLNFLSFHRLIAKVIINGLNRRLVSRSFHMKIHKLISTPISFSSTME